MLEAEVLRRRGYRVLEAAGGEEALLLSRDHAAPIHLLLTDLVMPRMSGQALAERFRLERPGIRVLYVSGYPQGEIGDRPLGEAAPPPPLKPFTPESLARKVREVLDGSGRSPGG